MRMLFIPCVIIFGLVSCGPRSNPRTPARNANLWMQTSAEYRALCWQTYAVALDRVARSLTSAKDSTAALPPAVVMDLDETVIDNSGFQTWLDIQGQDYSDRAWRRWVAYQATLPKPSPVPGAVAFIHRISALGVTPVFVSNRAAASRSETLVVLKRLGIDTSGLADPAAHRLLLRTDGRSKKARRALVRLHYRVIAWLGDSLADFSSDFEPGANADWRTRLGKLDRVRAHFGVDWFLLPNPSYGDWQRALAGQPARNQLQGPRHF